MTLTFTSETLPSDHKAAIRQMKRELRAQIGDVQAVFDRLSDKIASRVAEINALKSKGDPVWPVIPFADVQSGNISQEQREAVKRRGCAVIKGHFPREQALAWDNAMLDYLDLNRFDDVYKGPGDNFFGTLTASRPEIYPIYWSHAQMEARQSEEMAQVQSFLNRLWTFESNGKQWFNPDVSVIYPDRIRRRPPGTTSERPRRTYRLRRPGALAASGLSAGLCPGIRWQCRSIRSVECRTPYRSGRVHRG
ncbi:Protein of uncharacterised function (DUF1479) [Leclercia adecarboxylata]|uniref:Protein of uncharacterized function (DUF1479) n=1 Tax=Leclercia adecarboxylata TaxID=83655 RepID=A0A4U9HNF3_9ENTR|nr:Protein of uncharacterised function (DUF1479) [Leclercia adecarboxylata]